MRHTIFKYEPPALQETNFNTKALHNVYAPPASVVLPIENTLEFIYRTAVAGALKIDAKIG